MPKFIRIVMLNGQPYVHIVARVMTRSNKFKYIKHGQFPLATYLARY